MRLSSSVRALFEHLAKGDLESAWQSFSGELNDFIEAVEKLTGEGVSCCPDCDEPVWDDDLVGIGRYNDSCVCESCADSYTECYECNSRFSETTTVEGEEYCERCLRDVATLCDDCDEYYLDDSGHTHDCDCEAPVRKFFFPANGHGVVANDERLHVPMPSGLIDDVGIEVIVNKVFDSLSKDTQDLMPRWMVREAIEGIGHEWQLKTGNFTKRLSKVLHAQGIKLSKEIISEVGNLARAHSSDSTEWFIEFTRDLNQTAEDFVHEDSCWWGSYSRSRCALKNWGGMGMRSYRDGSVSSHRPEGRVWVQPLDHALKPTHRTEDAFAYVVFNGYGNLEGFGPARIVAHLTGKSYRKIELSVNEQYVNNNAGYLVADQATCDETDEITISLDAHYTVDAESVRKEAMVAV